MRTVRDYPSRIGDAASRRFETFSYLPPLSPEAVRQQVDYIIARGWTPAIEYTEPEHADETYWHMWKLPLFGETSVERVLAEVAACRKGNPNHHVRLVGYDKLRQTQGTAMLVHRGAAGNAAR